MLSLFMLALAPPPIPVHPPKQRPDVVEEVDIQLPELPRAGPTCLPPGIARGATIVAVGAYEGGLPVRPVATFEGSEVHSIRLSAAASGPPLILVLSAYEPVLWDLRAIPAGRLRAAIVYGYDDPSVFGAGRAVVRLNASSHQAGGCGDSIIAYKGGRELERLNDRAKAILAHPIDRFLGSYTQRLVTIDGPRALAAAPPDPRRALGGKAYRTANEAEGRFGFARLLKSGAIRRATASDIARLQRVLTKRSATGHLAGVSAGLSGPTYVVIRPIRVPDGMYGGYSVNFLVARGVPWPVDNGSHNRYWSLDTGDCKNVACDGGE